MARFVHNANIELYRRLIAESERDPKRDEYRHKMLLTLLTEEIAKDRKRDANGLAHGPAEELPKARTEVLSGPKTRLL